MAADYNDRCELTCIGKDGGFPMSSFRLEGTAQKAFRKKVAVIFENSCR